MTLTVYVVTCDLRTHDNRAYDAFLAAPSPKYMACVIDKDAFDHSASRSGKIFVRAIKDYAKALKDGIKMLRSYDSLKGADIIISSDTTPFARWRLGILQGIGKSVTVYDTKHLIPISTDEQEYKVYSSFYKSVIDGLIDDNMVGIPHPTHRHSSGVTMTPLYKMALECLDGFEVDEYRRLSKASIKRRQGSTHVSWALSRGIVSAREVFETIRKKIFSRGFGDLSSRRQEYGRVAFLSFVQELIYRDFYSRASLWWIPFDAKKGVVASYHHRFRNAKVHWKVTSASELVKMIPSAPLVIQTIYKTFVDTGDVSNYGRMLFATWVYDVGCDWMVGEAIFRKYLMDYDYSSNHWNWAHHSIQGLNFQYPSKKYKVELVTLDV